MIKMQGTRDFDENLIVLMETIVYLIPISGYFKLSVIELYPARESSAFLEETSAISFSSNAGLIEFNSSNKKKEGAGYTPV